MSNNTAVVSFSSIVEAVNHFESWFACSQALSHGWCRLGKVVARKAFLEGGWDAVRTIFASRCEESDDDLGICPPDGKSWHITGSGRLRFVVRADGTVEGQIHRPSGKLLEFTLDQSGELVNLTKTGAEHVFLRHLAPIQELMIALGNLNGFYLAKLAKEYHSFPETVVFHDYYPMDAHEAVAKVSWGSGITDVWGNPLDENALLKMCASIDTLLKEGKVHNIAVQTGEEEVRLCIRLETRAIVPEGTEISAATAKVVGGQVVYGLDLDPGGNIYAQEVQWVVMFHPAWRAPMEDGDVLMDESYPVYEFKNEKELKEALADSWWDPKHANQAWPGGYSIETVLNKKSVCEHSKSWHYIDKCRSII